METLIAPIINVLGLVGILYFTLKKKVVEGVEQRANGFEAELLRVRKMTLESQASLESHKRKIAAINEELAVLSSQYKKQAQENQDRLLGSAKKVAEGIRADVGASVEMAYKVLRKELLLEVVDGVVGRVEEVVLMKMTPDHRESIVDRFKKSVEVLR